MIRPFLTLSGRVQSVTEAIRATMQTIDALPFSSSPEQTDSTLRTYLCSQAYLPVEFVSAQNRSSGTTLYAPMYVFRASFSANWHASFGFDRQEHYTEYKTELINNVRRTTPVTRTPGKRHCPRRGYVRSLRRKQPACGSGRVNGRRPLGECRGY